MAIGVNVTTSEAPAAAGVPTDTGKAFIVGLADGGPTGAQLVHSIAEFIAIYGPRTSTSSLLYDSVDVYFREVGASAYIARVSDSTAVAASLTINDSGAAGTILATAMSPGVEGNLTYVAVTRQSAATFTADTTSGSPTLANVSSFANVGVGTRVDGAGITAGTIISSLNATAGTITLNANATASATGVTMTPTSFTVLIEDSTGSVLETHGPFATTAQLFADTSSQYVTFTQVGVNTRQPAALSATPLAGGVNATDLTDQSYVDTANAAFPASLGPGQIFAPGRTSNTVWSGLATHAQARNRIAGISLPDSPTAATLIASLGALTASQTLKGYVTPIGSTVIVPDGPGGTTRTVPGTAVWAALRARVSRTGNDNQAPAGINWPLQYVTGFTNTYSDADVLTLAGAGINVFANRFGVPCLFGFRSAATVDPIYNQSSAAAERMALVAQAQALGEPFVFGTLDGRGLEIAKFQGVLQGLIADHWAANALFGASATAAGTVVTAAPVNTAATEQAGQLNANLRVRISKYADQIDIAITVVPITQSV